jgi:uncharacterized membrane-anchored protein YjiN (DUF445 family)
METKQVETLAQQAVEEEKALKVLEEKYALTSKKFAEFLKVQKESQNKVEAIKKQIKEALIENEYFDDLENDNFKISVTKIANPKVTDIELLPENLVEVIKVAKMDKIKDHYKLYEELPQGVIDQPIYRLNFKVK